MTLKLPLTFIEKYTKLFGSRYVQFEKSLHDYPVEGFRLNPLKNDYKNVNVNLEENIEYSKLGYFGKIDGNSIDHISGYLYSQDPSAMYVSEVLDPQPGDKVLDLCAAPGSKTTHLAAKMNNEGILVANEINNSRAKILSSNIERMGISNTLVLNNRPDQLVETFNNYFDKIVVDAPCSGEGMFRKDNEAVNYWSLDYVEQCANRQKEILKSAYELLKPGGVIVYSTCTFSPEEDEQTALWFADEFNLEIEKIKKFTGMESGIPSWSNNDERASDFLRMFPDKFKGEGHFISKFRKSHEISLESKLKNNINSRLEKKVLELFDEFNKNNLSVRFNKVIQHNDSLENAVFNVNELDNNFHIIRNGIKLGTLKKNRFEPNHALILAINQNNLKNIVELNDNEYKNYIHGEVIRKELNIGSSWVGVSYQGKVFSWGKYTNNIIKNFYPKGLRK